jgi:hypothetical protein
MDPKAKMMAGKMVENLIGILWLITMARKVIVPTNERIHP